mmetsp:Transcript_96759/g.282894  ORF Transcript_96759/g.282894 Transcript_96759/m.282894 type:complete len:213 (-) Transcript_96759:1643-2281(-)
MTWWIATSMMSNSSSSSAPCGHSIDSSSNKAMELPMPWPAAPGPPGPRPGRACAAAALCCIIWITGLGISITGTDSAVITIRSRGRLSPRIGFESGVHMAIEMRLLMMLGGFSMGVTHLYRIMMSMKPKKQTMKTIMGMHSQKKFTQFLLYKALEKRSSRPRIMCATPNITESFIFKEFMNTSSFCAPCQAGSTPNGYGPAPPSFLVSKSGL